MRGEERNCVQQATGQHAMDPSHLLTFKLQTPDVYMAVSKLALTLEIFSTLGKKISTFKLL